jgi:hypothetical protein
VRKKKRPFRAPRGAIVQAPDGRWRIEIDDVADLDRTLGRAVLEALLACLVLSDRLSALAHFIYLCESFDRDGATWQRNVGTAHYLASGVLRELSHSTKALRSALYARGWYDKADSRMVELRRFEKEWDGDRRLIDARDKAAFHLNDGLMAQGLKTLAGRRTPLVLLQGDGTKYFQVYTPMGQQVVFDGLGFSDQDKEFFMRSTAADLGIAIVLKDIAEDLLRKADLPLKKEQWS